MYSFLRGKLSEILEGMVVLEIGGIGYSIWIPLSYELPSIGTEITLFTSFVVRENSQALYGFLEKSERQLFDILLTISGIGPKTALSLLSHLKPGELQEAVLVGNTKNLSKTPGIGKKTAERLILELKGKLDALIFSPASPLTKIEKEAVTALTNLGFTARSAQNAVEKALKKDPSCDLAALIRTALTEK